MINKEPIQMNCRDLFFSTLLLLLLAGCGKAPGSIRDLPSRYVLLDDSIKVHYKTWGDGAKTVMFVHGFGCDMNAWEAQYEAFRNESDMRLLFVDLPGYGSSDKPHVSYTLSFFSHAVRSVLDTVRCDYAFLVGHSLGTPVCRQAFFEDPARVAGLMDIDGVYCLYPKLSDSPTPEEQAAAEGYEAAVQSFASSFDGSACQENIKGFVRSLSGPDTPDEITEYAMSRMPQTPEYVASSTMHNLIDHRWWNGIPFPMPAEVLCTQNSGLEPDNKEQMLALYPMMRYTELETCGHFIQLEQPDTVNESLRRLMDTAINYSLESYEFAIKELEQNYAGFPWVVTEDRRPEYEKVKQEYRDSIASGLMYGPDGISEMCYFMQDYHLGCTYRIWSKRFPLKWPDYSRQMKVYDPKPLARKINEKTFLLRFPTCQGDDEYVKWTRQAVDQYRRSGCEQLIVDIRGNGGGADWQYYPIFQLLYLQPGKTHGMLLRNTKDNRDRWQPWIKDNEELKAVMDSAAAHSSEPFFAMTEEYSILKEDHVDPRRPQKTAIIIDRSVGSSGEQLLLDVKAVAPDVRLYGRDNTLGCIDISNVTAVRLPHVPNTIHIPTTVSYRVVNGEGLIDGKGIEPDVRISLPLPDTLSDNVDSWVRWVAENM